MMPPVYVPLVLLLLAPLLLHGPQDEHVLVQHLIEPRTLLVQ